jgi:hypothetical protein
VSASEHADDVSALSRLFAQLKILLPTLTVAPGRPETTAMLAGLRETTAGVAGVLALVEPEALAAIRRALDYAVAGLYDESCSELIHARNCLVVLMRRSAAATEPTLRWSLDTARAPSPVDEAH